MHFYDGFVAGRVFIDRGRGSAPRKTAAQVQNQNTFRLVNLKEER
jgi:hypothetical protein